LLGIVRQAMQFGLHQWIQLIERARVSAAPRYQKLSDVLLRWRGRRRTRNHPNAFDRAVENALFNRFGGSSLFVVLHPEKIFLPNGGFGRLLPL
jgi:hypothetical protein